jgi:hypothetical protein
MVHVGMRDDYVAHFRTVFTSGSKRDAAGVNGNTPIDEKTSQTLF